MLLQGSEASNKPFVVTFLFDFKYGLFMMNSWRKFWAKEL